MEQRVMGWKSVFVMVSAMMMVVLVGLAVPFASGEDATRTSASADEPNIVLILADDIDN